MENNNFNTQIKLIGSNIKRLRKSRKLTQEKFSESIQIEKARLSRIENGKANPTVKTLVRIADALETNLSYLISSEIL